MPIHIKRRPQHWPEPSDKIRHDAATCWFHDRVCAELDKRRTFTLAKSLLLESYSMLIHNEHTNDNDHQFDSNYADALQLPPDFAQTVFGEYRQLQNST